MVLPFVNRICVSRLFTVHTKVGYCRFHTLKKVDNILINKTFPPSKLLIPKRNFFWIFKKRTKSEIRLVDKPPSSHYELIYRCAFDNVVLSCQHLCFYATVIVCLIVIYKAHRFYDMPPKKGEFFGQEVFVGKVATYQDNEMTLLIAAFLTVYCLITFGIGRMPVRIYCYPQQQKYLIYFYGMIPNQLKTLAIRAGEVKHKPGKSSVFPWNQELYNHENTGQRMVLIEEYFRYPADLYIMLGLQQDPDVNYDYEDQLNKSNKKKLEDK